MGASPGRAPARAAAAAGRPSRDPAAGDSKGRRRLPQLDSPAAVEAEPDPQPSRLGPIALLAGLAALGVFAGFSWLLIIGALAFTIFMHELGHYLTARWTGMKVTEFFIGFGPRIWSFRRGETTYGIKALWAGAYVRIVGMNNLDEVEPGDEPRSFRRQTYPRKLLVLVAGSGMHFLMALGLLFAVLLVDGSAAGGSPAAERDDWTVATVSSDSAASAAGLQPGDELISVDGVPRGDFAEFGRRVSTELKGARVRVVYAREGVEQTAVVAVGERLTEAGAAGIRGLIAGDRILAVEGLRAAGPPSYSEVAEHARSRLGRPLDITILDARSGERAEVRGAVITEVADEAAATSGFFGVSARYERQGLGPLAAAGNSVTMFAGITRDVVFAFPSILTEGLGDTLGWLVGADGRDGARIGSIGELETRRLETSHPDENRLLSIYGVARLGAEAASDGVLDMLLLLLFVNIFIGVFNLLPLLPLDGGHVAVATYERIRSIGGRSHRVDAARLLPFTYAVVALLALLGCVALMRDIIDPVSFG